MRSIQSSLSWCKNCRGEEFFPKRGGWEDCGPADQTKPIFARANIRDWAGGGRKGTILAHALHSHKAGKRLTQPYCPINKLGAYPKLTHAMEIPQEGRLGVAAVRLKEMVH